jgi:ribosomal protein S18 acetylase RimI-like enzyme
MTLLNDEGAATEAVPHAPAGTASAAHRIRPAAADDAARMASALAAAFHDDPVFRWFAPDEARRHAMLPGFFVVFVEAFMTHGETYVDEDGAGAALWAAPGADPLGADPAYGERLAEIVGVDAPRMFEIVGLLEAHAPQTPHYHLQFLGVRPERQGGGIGGALMAPVLERCDRDGATAYLEATSDRNRAMYERHGYRADGDIPLPDGPALWRMWREPVV